MGFRAQLQFAATAYDPFETFVTGSFWEGCIRRAIEQPWLDISQRSLANDHLRQAFCSAKRIQCGSQGFYGPPRNQR